MYPAVLAKCPVFLHAGPEIRNGDFFCPVTGRVGGSVILCAIIVYCSTENMLINMDDWHANCDCIELLLPRVAERRSTNRSF